MVKAIVAMILGMIIGAACRWFDVPLPAPPRLLGALLVLSITAGYLATDRLMATGVSAKEPALSERLNGGPTGK